jgi:hypothetical protein
MPVDQQLLPGKPPLPRVSILIFLLLGLMGSFLVYYATAWGPWAFSDATGYLTAARNLVAGHGIGAFDAGGRFSPGVSHPPLYVLALGAVSLLGLDPLQAARALDVLLFGLLVATCGVMLCRVLGSRGAGLAFSALLLVHPALLIAYTSAMAEPPFILLGLLSLLFLADYLREPRSTSFVAGALAAGGALLSRYTGAAFVLTGAAGILLWGGPRPAVRVRRAAAFAALGALPVGVFLLWTATLAEAEGPRALAGAVSILPGLVRFGRSVGAAVWGWKPVPPAVLLPDWLGGQAHPQLISGILAAAGLSCLAVLAYRSTRGLRGQSDLPERTRASRLLLLVLALFVGIYLVFFAIAYLVTDPTPDVDSRTLLPLLPALLGMIVGVAHATSRSWAESKWLRPGWIAILLAALAGYAVISQDIVLGLHRTGLGYTGREWRDSPTLAAVLELPEERGLISNEPSAILLLTGKTPYSIFEIAQRSPTLGFTAFGSGSTEAEQAFRRGQAVLVLFESIHDQFRSLYQDRSAARFSAFISGLRVLRQTADGAIYEYSAGGGEP